jgi:hypothetical protein
MSVNYVGDGMRLPVRDHGFYQSATGGDDHPKKEVAGSRGILPLQIKSEVDDAKSYFFLTSKPLPNAASEKTSSA